MTTINPSYLPPSFYDASGNLTVTQQQAETVSAGVQARVDSMPPAQRELFLAMLAISDIAPSGGQPPANLEESLNRLEQVSVALANLSYLTGTSADFLARVMIEQAGQQRKDALEGRLMARESAKSELVEQAGKLKDAADKMMSGAIAQLVIAVVAAAATFVLAGISAARAGTALGSANEASKLGANGANATAASTQTSLAGAQGAIATGWSSASQATGTLGAAMGNAINSMYQADAKELEAEGSLDSANAQEMQSLADIKKEIQQAVDELIKAVINFIKEMKEAEVNQMQSLTKL